MSTRTSEDFLQLTRQGLRSARALLDFLERENTALREDDLDTFLALAQQKKEKITALEDVDRPRVALLQAACLPADEGGTAAFIDASPPPLPQQWQAFLETLKACQRQNATNGRMIHARQHQLQQALEILRGQFGEEGLAYDQQGRPTKSQRTTPIAKA